MKPTFCLLFLLYNVAGFAQLGSAEKTALRNMEKHRWQKAENKLRKTLERDTLNPSIRYVLSVFYFEAENPAFHIDSAYHYIVGALNDYQQSPERDQERLRRGGLDSLQMVSHRARIDSAAFELARTTNTEAAYLEFLNNFPSAAQRDLAVALRDEVAYQEARRQNTYKAFYSFITRYPNAQRVPEARAHYDRLLYFEETKDKRLASYDKFLLDHPETPYRREIYANIFEIITADGSVASFLSFMNRYPVSDLVTKARQIVFHLLGEEDDPRWPSGFLNDSLRALLDINRAYLVPFLKNGRYGFMDEHGREVIAARYSSIDDEYLCGQVIDEVLIADNQLVARNGTAIFRGPISNVTDISAGFLKVETADDTKIVHKSGFLFADSVEDARVIGKGFITLKQRGKWSLYTLAGRQLDKRSWDDITAMGELIVFSQDSRRFIVPRKDLSKAAEGDPLPLSEPFDGLKLWPDGMIWGKSGEYEGIFDQSLQTVIRFDKHRLTRTPFGAIAEVPNGIVLYNHSGRKSSAFDQVSQLTKRIGVKKNGMWFFYNPDKQVIDGRGYDSLRAEGAFVIGSRADTVYVHFEGSQHRTFYRPGQISFVPGRDSTSFLTVEDNAPAKRVFDLKGNELFTAAFEALEYAGKGLFVVTRKEKKGLLDMRGKSRLPAEFDAIGTANGDVVSILKNKRFGAYHALTGQLIKPQYDRNPVPYGSSAVITFKDGYYGFLGWDNKPISVFEFDEVRYWNDSLALVKKGSLWSLFDLKDRTLVETNLRGITMIRDTPDDKLAIIHKDNGFGVISNHGKIIIPPTFTEVINLGSPDVPLYFTEKHVPEASLYIVIYYDRSGEMLRKEIYDDAADYDRIYCSDN